MVRHSIAEATVRRDPRAGKREPVNRTVTIAKRSAGFAARADVFFAAAASLDLRSWWVPEYGKLTVCGFVEHVDAAEVLFTSLLVQMDNACHTAMTAFRRDGAPLVWDERVYGYRPVHGRTYRASFLAGYAHRVAQRLVEARRASRRVVQAETTGSALVLADKKAQVDAWVDANFKLGKGRASGVTSRSSDGYAAGVAAGARAALGGHQVGGGARALTG